MDTQDLVGQKVMLARTRKRGIIKSVENGKIKVDFHGEISYFPFSALDTVLILENIGMRAEWTTVGYDADFDSFRNFYSIAIEDEISYLRKTGGRTYHATDGIRVQSAKNDNNMYTFDTDTEFHFPDGTGIRIKNIDPERNIYGSIISCDEYTITIHTDESLGQNLERIEFTADQWQLLEALNNRLSELNQTEHALAYEVACRGRSKIREQAGIICGQNAAFNRATSKPITFIWGPPGTGKTHTLATIALDYIKRGKRVLMLSYSNVSVDGAVLRVAERSDFPVGKIIRYGYPRLEEVLNNDELASYQLVLKRNPDLKSRYDSLIEERKRTKRKSERRLELNEEIDRIRKSLQEKEKELTRKASFIATTVSKAIVDKTIYDQRFDLVIFDEASMAYVPQIVFAASLARSNFVCLGDFRQLPAIVQNGREGSKAEILEEDIFYYTGIAEAVEAGCGHEWLVMLTEQYRMHPDISNFIGKELYNDKLMTDPMSIGQNVQIAGNAPLPDEAMVFLDLSGMYSLCIKTRDNSRVNILSAMICFRLAEMFFEKYEVGIVTPYNAQSSFVTAMLRDLKERNPRYENITCATVHQFQGSEKSVIIYDAVDCYLMRAPGGLLTNQKNGVADRLFNVALSRSRGKFFLLANKDYFDRKKISPELLFSKTMKKLTQNNDCVQGTEILNELKTENPESAEIYFSDREQSWEWYLSELSSAQEDVWIEIPGLIAENDDAIQELGEVLTLLDKNGVDIIIRKNEGASFPKNIEQYINGDSFVTNPVTVIDHNMIWYGHPMADESFVTGGEYLRVKYFPCIRFAGEHTAKILHNLLW